MAMKYFYLLLGISCICLLSMEANKPLSATVTNKKDLALAMLKTVRCDTPQAQIGIMKKLIFNSCNTLGEECNKLAGPNQEALKNLAMQCKTQVESCTTMTESMPNKCNVEEFKTLSANISKVFEDASKLPRN